VSVEPKGPDPMGEVIGGIYVSDLWGTKTWFTIEEERVASARQDRSITLYHFYALCSNKDAIDDITYKFVPDTLDFSASTTTL
jgi:hypothetical protein